MEQRRAPFAIVPIAAILDNRLTPEQLRVLIALLSFADAAGQAHPSHEHLSMRARAHPDNVKKAMRALEKMGWIKRHGAPHRGSNQQYQISHLYTPEGGVKSPPLSAPQRGGEITPPFCPKGGAKSPPLSLLQKSEKGGVKSPLKGGAKSPPLDSPPYGGGILTDQEQTSVGAALPRHARCACTPAGAGARGARCAPPHKNLEIPENVEIENGGEMNGRKARENLINSKSQGAAPAPAAAPAAGTAAPARAAAAPKNTPQNPPKCAQNERTRPRRYPSRTEPTKRAKTPKKGILAPAPSDVPPEVFREWQQLRRAHRAGCGSVAIAAARAEAKIAGVDFATFLEAWILRGTKGFTAEWYRNGGAKSEATGEARARSEYEKTAEMLRLMDEQRRQAVPAPRFRQVNK